MEVRYGNEWRDAQRIGASAAGAIRGLSQAKDRALLLQMVLNDRLTLPNRRYLLALRVSLRLSDNATWQALILGLHAEVTEGAEQLRAMLTDRLEHLLEALTAWIKVDAPDTQPPPLRPLQLRPDVRPGAPFHL